MCTRATHFHTTTFSAGTYLALPFATLQSTLVVFNGVGIRRTTLVADSLLLKFALMVTTYETWVVPISVTVGMMRSGNFTFDVERYLLCRCVSFNKDLGFWRNIPHKLEFTVWWNETDRARRVEFV